ncbi:MAG: ATP-binding protein [Hydrogenothermaceae bacterium]
MIDLRNKKTQNTLIASIVIFLFLSSNLYIYTKLIKVKEIFNPYLFLFILNIDIIFLLIIIATSLKYLIKIFFEKNLTGKLRIKLSIILISIITIPSIILFTVSVSLISSATNLWFSGKVGSAIGKLDEIVSYNLITNQEWLTKTYTLIYNNQISPEVAYKTFGLTSIATFDKLGKIREFYGKELNKGELNLLSKTGIFISGNELIFVGLSSDGGKVLMTYELPDYLLLSKEQLSTVSQIYQEFRYYKTPIRIGYILILLSITVAVIFAGLWLSRFIARQITLPLEELTRAVYKLSEGDLSVRVNIKSSDEIGVLIDQFNKMVEHLDYLYRKLQDKNLTLKKNKDYLEAILDNIKTGVIYSSEEGVVESINKSVVDIIGEEILQIKKQDIDKIKEILNIDMKKEQNQTIEYQGKTLVVKVKNINKRGYVVVIDDITQLIVAQKLNTWKEITQRLAHEIKNPLTPIKLSAERILTQSKKSNPNLPEIIEKSVSVIIKEVEHLSNLVRDFSQFGKNFTSPNISSIDVCALLNELKESYNYEDFKIDIVCPDKVYIKADQKLLKQAFSNIIQNSFESASKLSIKIDKEDNKVRIEFIDNGPGIPQDQLDKIFLPYFSNKPKGSGLGLAISKEIIENHGGSIKALYSKEGAHIVVELPINPST